MTSAVGVHPQRRRRRRRRLPTPRGNPGPEISTDDQRSHLTSPRSGGSDAFEIRDRFTHIFSPSQVPRTILVQGCVEQGHNISGGDDTDDGSYDNSRRHRGRTPTQMIREPAQMLYPTNEALVETNDYPRVDNLNDPRLLTALQYNEQFQSIAAFTPSLHPETSSEPVNYRAVDLEPPFALAAGNEYEGLNNIQFRGEPSIPPYLSTPETSSSEGPIPDTINLHQVIESPTESHWRPLPMYQGTFATQNDDELFNMACILPPQGDPSEQPAPMDYREDAFLFDEGFIPSTTRLQLNIESTRPHTDSNLLDLLSAENEAGYNSQYFETGLAVSQFDSHRSLGDSPSNVRSQLGEHASLHLNPSSGNTNATSRLGNTRDLSSGSVLTSTSGDTVESLDPELFFDF